MEIVSGQLWSHDLWLINILRSYRRTYMPETYHIAQEIQKYNIPDYRPRQEQYVCLASCLGNS